VKREEEYNEGVPLSILVALPFHHLLRGREREKEREVKKRRQPDGGEDRWRGPAGSDFVN